MRLRLVIPVLLACSVAACTSTREKEALLRNHLFTLRSSISQYTLDKQRPPQRLAQLVDGGYLREIPQDPITGKADWQVIMEDAYMSVDQTRPGIWDVKSTATTMSTEGTPYNSW